MTNLTDVVDHTLEVRLKEKKKFATNQGDQVVKQLEYFSMPLYKIPIMVMVKTMSEIVAQTLMVSLSTVGSQILVSSGYIYLNMNNSSEAQAALGIALSYNLLFFYGFFLSMIDKLGIDLSVSFGAKHYHQTKKILNQGMLVCLLCFCFMTVPGFLFAEQILVSINISPELAKASQEILYYLMIANFIEMNSDFFRTFSMAQGFEDVFGHTSLLSVVVAVICGWYLVVQLQLGAVGWVYSKIIYEALTSLVALGMMLATQPETRGFISLSETCQGFSSFFCECVKFSIGSYTEFLGYEISSYFVYISHDKTAISAYSAMLNCTTLFYAIGETFQTVCRTRMNILIGKKLI